MAYLTNRLVALIVCFVLVIIAEPSHPTWWQFDLLLGAFGFGWLLLVAPEDLSFKMGLIAIAVGAGLMALAFAVAANHHYTLERLRRDGSLFWGIRRLPVYSGALIAFGTLTVLESLLRFWRRRRASDVA